MMWRLAYMVAMATVLMVECQHCPTTKQDGGNPEFSRPMGDLAYGCLGQFTNLQCCANNYDNITWYYRNSEGADWQQFPFGDTDNIYLGNDKNQTLEIRTTEDYHAGLYRCDVTRPGDNPVTNTWELRVADCYDGWNKAPAITLPRSSIRAHFSVAACLGENATLYCGGFFGKKKPENYIIWNRAFPNDTFADAISENTSKFTVIEVIRQRGALIELYLNVTNVTQADLKNRYFCSMANDYGYPPNVNARITQCQPPTTITKWPVWLWWVVGSVAALLLVTIITAAIVAPNYQRLKLWKKNTFPKREHIGDKIHDVTIVHADDECDVFMCNEDIEETDGGGHETASQHAAGEHGDGPEQRRLKRRCDMCSGLANEIAATLKNLGYNVGNMEQPDFLWPGHTYNRDMSTAVAGSRSIVVIVTKHFVQRPLYTTIWDNFFHYTERGPVVYIVAEPVETEDIEPAMRESFSMALNAGNRLQWKEAQSKNAKNTKNKFWFRLQNFLPTKLSLLVNRPDDDCSHSNSNNGNCNHGNGNHGNRTSSSAPMIENVAEMPHVGDNDVFDVPAITAVVIDEHNDAPGTASGPSSHTSDDARPRANGDAASHTSGDVPPPGQTLLIAPDAPTEDIELGTGMGDTKCIRGLSNNSDQSQTSDLGTSIEHSGAFA